MLSIEKNNNIGAYSRNESHRKSFKKTTTECNHYLNRSKKRFWKISPLMKSISSTL